MIPPLVTLQKMAHASYHHPPREGENEIGGWTLVQENEWVKFYAKGNEVVIATRGSQTGEDWTDANRRIPFNDLESSTVYKRNEDYIKQFKANNPQYTTYYGIGHSLSGAINDIYLRKGIVSEAVSYNPAVETQYLRAQVPNHRRIYMKDDPLYKLMGQWLVQTPEVRASKISTATWLARFTPIGNVLTADQYLKAHDIKEFEGGRKCKMCGLPKRKGKGVSSSVPVVDWKPIVKEIFNSHIASEDWRMLIIDNLGNTRQQKIKQRSINGTLFLYIERDLLDRGITVPNRDDLLQYVIQLVTNWVSSLSLEVQDPTGPEPDGQGRPKLILHAVIVKKPYDLHEAKVIARDVMKSKKDKFMRETSTSYRFRNLPKTKFSSFVTKVLNPNVSLVLGNLK